MIAFGHHADDFAETTLLNLIYGGRVETMFPSQAFFKGEFRVIRPLCYTPEKDLRHFARLNPDFPSPPPECSRSDHSRRKLVKDFIGQAGKMGKQVRSNLVRVGLRGNTQAGKQ